MKALKFTLLLLVSTFFLVGCKSSKNVAKNQLTADKWVLKSMNNVNADQLFKDKTPYLMFNFDQDKVLGNSGCNLFSGKATYKKGRLHVSDIASTLMACEGAQGEATFLNLLANQSKLSIMNGELIFSQNERPVMIFYRAEPLAEKDLSGTWVLETMEGKNASSEFKGKLPTLELNFVDYKVSGNAGCNRYNSSFSLAKNVLVVKQLVTTRMACNDLTGETKFVQLFSGRFDIDLEDNVLQLRKDNVVVFTFKK